MKLTYCLLLFGSLLLGSCKEQIQFSLLESRPNESKTNYVNIGKIQQIAIKDTFNFVIISDTQVAYNELEDFVKHINKEPEDSIKFILHGGDITDYGANFEYNAYHEVIKKVKFPIVAVIGNHDMLGSGRDIFNKMFGDDNFIFTYGKTSFVFHNTNSREAVFDGFIPNMNWLRSAYAKVPEDHNLFIVAHVPPFSFDFDKTMEQEYTSTIAGLKQNKLAIYGHNHSFSVTLPYDDGVPYLVAPNMEKKQYVKIRVENDKFYVQLKTF